MSGNVLLIDTLLQNCAVLRPVHSSSSYGNKEVLLGMYCITYDIFVWLYVLEEALVPRVNRL